MAPTQKLKKKQAKKARETLVGVSKKPIRRLFTYKDEDLINAIDSIKNKSMGFREACRFYGVPFATVHDRLSGKVAVDKKPRVGPNPVLGVQGEEKLSKWVLDMAKCGFPVNKQGLLESVSKIITKTGIKTPFKNSKPGDTWYQKFLKRHPEISIREPEGINNARAAITENRIRHWFKELQEYIKSIDAVEIFEDPERIFNGDETGFSLCPKSGKVLGPKGYKNLYIIKKNNEKENITVLLVFSASGKLCPPLVIFPYIRPPKALVDNMPESWVLGRSESGWMKSDVFYEYITNDFNAWLMKNEVKKPILLFIDGHKSHMTYALSQFCQANGIILYALPPNSTHILQPADVSVFRPLKQNWKTTVKHWQSENVNQIVTKLNFCSILKQTISQTQLEGAIIKGFRRCGLYPLNENNVDYTKCVRDSQQKVEREKREKKSSMDGKATATAKEFDAAIKVISLLKTDLARRNIDPEPILEVIEMGKTKYLQNRRSKSKTPRNSAVSNQTTSIITNQILTDTAPDDIDMIMTNITPENLIIDKPTNTPHVARHHGQNIEVDTSELITDTLFVTDENISFPEPGSYISLNNISVMPIDEFQLSQLNTTELASEECCTLTVSADVHAQQNATLVEISNNLQGQLDQTVSFDDIFAKHLHFPEPTEPKDKKPRPKLPSAISSQAWREHYKKKEEDKENLDLEKKKKQQLRAEEKERKAKEKETRKKKKKTVSKKCPKKANLKCSQCSEELISDVEEDLEKNLGCDECIRWFHLKCTEMYKKPYAEAAVSAYTCPFCLKGVTEN